ncbi:hypothetical protein BFJ69_g9936 [Fusarium oxysporum]|uniref:Uncharacterized protein n=1 Tax=Fusarium oxysporum TaxID=5507 RepID=A0A420MX68_FUSOX|nr:hypothetical protein BFJ69_g9936 [Fusarium oxysporum]
MKFLPLAVALFATLTVAAPSSPSNIQARSCVCKKVGDDWICTGTKCYDKVKRDLVPRQCSCHKIGDEWLCGGPKCPRDLPEENKLAKRQCSCHKVGDEWLCGGPKCPRSLPAEESGLEKRQCSCKKVRSKSLSNPFIIAKREASGRSSVKSTYARLVSWQELVERVITDSTV